MLRNNHKTGENSQPCPDTPLRLSIGQKILFSYMKNKTSELEGDYQLKFLKRMHGKLCNGQMCKCNEVRDRIIHLEGCLDFDCKVCGPIHRIFGNPKKGVSSEKLEETMPPKKRLKMEFDPLKALNCNFERLPALQQLPDSPESNKSEIMAGLEGNSIKHGTGICADYVPHPCSMPTHPQGFSADCEVVRTKYNLAMPKEDNDYDSGLANGIGSDTLTITAVSLSQPSIAPTITQDVSTSTQQIVESILKEENGNTIGSASDNTCRLCGNDKLMLAPPPIYCSSCGARIKFGVNYYSTAEETTKPHCFCTKCIRLRGGSISFCGTSVLKANLCKKKNSEEIEESWVQCDKCEGWVHQICGGFNNETNIGGKAEYLCPICRSENRGRLPVPEHDAFRAKDLPKTVLSDHIEQRLFRRLQQERQEATKCPGKNPDEVPGADDLVVRVVSSFDKNLKVKQMFLDIFQNKNYPTEFLYKSKVILLFQKIEGVDVCLLGMYVQEYGSECSHPNNRCVYISYLDSVKYFKPETRTSTGEALRTFVYHEILIGYLEYCKKRGFATCHIWACPPVKGEDYILYCHPDDQKTPRTDKLRKWYHSMLRKAAKEDIVVEFTNLYDHFFVRSGESNSQVTAARLPYFDGDNWTNFAEDVISNMGKESDQEIQRTEKNLITKRALKSMGNTNPSSSATKDILLMQKLGQRMLPLKDDFIVVHLHYFCSHCHEVILSQYQWCCTRRKNFRLCERCFDAESKLKGGNTHNYNGKDKHLLYEAWAGNVPSHTKDEDITIEGSLLDDRRTFLGFCQKKHYQFDTLRRAKHSTMMILHFLHNPTEFTINLKSSISPKSASAIRHGINTEELQMQHQMKELLDLVVHASQCKATKRQPCGYPFCRQTKNLYHHALHCSVRSAGGCVLCRRAWALLIAHSRCCGQLPCVVPRCQELREARAANVAVQPGLD